MQLRSLLFRRIVLWALFYLWSATGLLTISALMQWQYDGNGGWWVATIYGAPALILASSFHALFSNQNTALAVAIAILIAISAVGLIVEMRVRKG
ncbi:ABC-type uncharacterized transport system permease subunit [Stakelama sediminis]|uniref:ABC-type uncharacterized transport system permease subunit n=1 Tax=Stakelama sediminis TaxID=463200 RepID=A0A840Z1S0_9SPHN|nr:hypothetical protein [Stakelama sediminis]MBB5720081.1 ABC-type uncharacterized transport system permease subunit [Stakelama sediminis]